MKKRDKEKSMGGKNRLKNREKKEKNDKEKRRKTERRKNGEKGMGRGKPSRFTSPWKNF